MDAAIAIRLLGPMELQLRGAVRAAGGPTQRAVLAMLALRIDEPVGVDQLIEGLWGESDEPLGGGKAIQVHVSRLRTLLKAARPGALATVPGGYCLRGDDVAIDAHDFGRELDGARQRLAAGELPAAAASLHRAMALWRGPALMDLRYFPFAASVADRYDELRVDAAEEELEVRLALGESGSLVPELQGLIAEHPYRERLRRQLMLALYRVGQQAAALDAYQAARSRLALDLGVEPGPELQRLEQLILAQAAELASSPPAGPPQIPLGGSPISRLPHALPAAPHLVGRDELLGDLARLAAGQRLLTLTGTGGSGKTVLALALLHRLAPRYAGGAAFVDLAPVSRADQVLPAIATDLRLSQAGGGLPERIGDHLSENRMVVVLDNLEHLLDAGPDLATLVNTTSGLFIATSRSPLRLHAEHVVEVPPLPVPSDDTFGLAQEPAVRLFLQAATSVGAPIGTGPGDLAAVSAICRAVDGLPLAIEIAAAQTQVEDVRELAANIGERLPALRARARDVPARQRTMDAAIRWSVDRLDADGRRAFARLAVFPGSFDTRGASHVLQTQRPRATEVMVRLLEASLLVRQPPAAGQARFRMLEPVRTVARAFALPEDSAAAAERHADFVQAEVHRLCPATKGIGQPEDLAQLRVEHATLMAALGYLSEAAPDRCVDTIVQLEDYWIWTGGELGAKELVDATLAGQDLSDRARCDALLLRASFAFGLGSAQESVAALEAAISLVNAVSDHATRARARRNEARFAIESADQQRARRVVRMAIAEARRAGNPRLLARCLYTGTLTYVWWMKPDDEPAAEFHAWLEEGFRLARGGPMPFTETDFLTVLVNYLAYVRSDRAEATTALRSALDIDRRFDAPERVAFHATALGSFAVEEGSIEPGRLTILSALRTLDRSGHRLLAVQPLGTVAEVEAALGRWRNALILMTASRAIAATMGTSFFETFPDVGSVERAAELHLEPAVAAEARELGRHMTYREAVDFAYAINGIAGS